MRRSMPTATAPRWPATATGSKSRIAKPGSPRSKTTGSPTAGAAGRTRRPDCTGSPGIPGARSPTTTAVGTCTPAMAGSGSRARSTPPATCTGTGGRPMSAGSPGATTSATTGAWASVSATVCTDGPEASGIPSTPGSSVPPDTWATAAATPTAAPCAAGIRSSPAASSRRTRTGSTTETGGTPTPPGRCSSRSDLACPKANSPT